MEAMKDQMATMMEAMLSMKKIMESNAVAVATTNAAAEVDPTHPSGVNQMSRSVPDAVGQGGEALGSTSDPHVVQSKNSFPPYDLPPNYMPPNVVHMPDENADHSAPVPLESQQPHAHFSQPTLGAREEPQDHALADFEPYPGYATEGLAFGGMPQSNTSRGPQHRPLQPLHFSVGRLPPAMEEREKFDLIEES